MNHFKFLTNNNDTVNFLVNDYFLPLRPAARHSNNEFCMQFDDDEPFVFARGNTELTITVSPTADGNITFNHNGRTFKLFARESE